jgi:penicillin amidase
VKNQRIGLVNSKFLIASCVATALALSACGEDSTKPGADAVSDTIGDVLLPADTSSTNSDVTSSDTVGDNAKQQLILSVPKSEEWLIAGLEAEVHVVRTEGDVAHVYAKNRKDLSRVMGFVMARHRYFQLELTRRLGLGEISALLGDAALTQDMESRWSGSTYVAESVLERLTPAEQELFDAFAAGINDYIAQVIAGKLPQPSEIAIAKGLLGGDLASLLKPWTRRSVAGASAAIIYNLGYERDDVGRTGEFAKLETLFSGKPLEQLR